MHLTPPIGGTPGNGTKRWQNCYGQQHDRIGLHVAGQPLVTDRAAGRGSGRGKRW